jgi:hypothetical protein
MGAVVCISALMGAGANAALAGEVNGNGDPVRAVQVTHSICAFSGQNDKPLSTDPEDPGGRVQSYGYNFVSKGLKAVVPSPSVGCNGHTGFLSGGSA